MIGTERKPPPGAVKCFLLLSSWLALALGVLLPPSATWPYDHAAMHRPVSYCCRI